MENTSPLYEKKLLENTIADEEEDFKSSMDVLMSLLAEIRCGNVQNVRMLLDEEPPKINICLGTAPLRHQRNLANFYIGCIMSAGYDAGLPISLCTRLWEHFVQSVENAADISEINTTFESAALDFTQYVRDQISLKTNNARIRRVVQYINDNYTKKFTLKELASVAEVSEEYLSRLFRKETSITLKEYIQERKVAAACRLLKGTNNDLVIIADFLSFSSQSHFQKVFKSYKGVTPMEYRTYVKTIYKTTPQKQPAQPSAPQR